MVKSKNICDFYIIDYSEKREGERERSDGRIDGDLMLLGCNSKINPLQYTFTNSIPN